VFDSLDGILLSGGGDIEPQLYGAEPTTALRSVDPRRDQVEILLARWAAETGKPFLGICRGLQVVNVALGGNLVQDIASEIVGALPHDQPDPPPAEVVHRLAVARHSVLFSLVACGTLGTNSFHHQAVRRLAPGLAVRAVAEDGVVEAVELTGHPFGLAVQWHPERMLDQASMVALFVGLTEAASRG
jgi:putative glutamine amidotransferase